jgi:hypothetical protein
MAGLLTDIQELSGPGKCVVGIFIGTLSVADQKDLELAFDKPFAGTVIFEVLRKRGATFSVTALTRHRRKVCSCDFG